MTPLGAVAPKNKQKNNSYQYPLAMKCSYLFETSFFFEALISIITLKERRQLRAMTETSLLMTQNKRNGRVNLLPCLAIYCSVACV
jgi:hypothetical protein